LKLSSGYTLDKVMEFVAFAEKDEILSSIVLLLVLILTKLVQFFKYIC
jgi:hypothetical protein